MRLFLTAAFLFIGFLVFGQGFNKRYDAFGNGFYQQAFNIERVDSGYVIIGGTEDYDTIAPGSYYFHASVLLTWIDEMGVKRGEKKAWRDLHNTTVGWSNCCDTIPGGGYVVGGASEDSLGNDEVYLMRFDTLGDTLWTKVFGDANLNFYYIGRQVKQTNDGGFLIVGDTNQNGPVRGFALKTNSNGMEQWRRFYDWGSSWNDALISCANISERDLIMAGTRNFSFTNHCRPEQS